jgi:hypothetical protein
MKLLYAGKDSEGRDSIINMDQVAALRRDTEEATGTRFVVLTLVNPEPRYRIRVEGAAAQWVWDWAFGRAARQDSGPDLPRTS